VPVKSHLALVASVFSAALVAGRILAIARFDISTAATILQTSGTTTAIAGTALTLLPFLLVLLVGGLSVVAFIDPSLLDVSQSVVLTAFWVCVGGTLCMAPAPLAVTGLLVALGVAATSWVLRRRGHDTDVAAAFRSSRLLRAEGTLFLVVTVMVPILVQRPWLPVQVIGIEDAQPVVGYVLGDADGKLAVLEDADRTVVFLDPATITSRRICSGPPHVGGVASKLPQLDLGGSLLSGLLWGDHVPKYDPCSDG
jgi:hypothetical protein